MQPKTSAGWGFLYTITVLFFSAVLCRAANFPVSTASYLGTNSVDDAIFAVDVAPDATIVLGGRLAGFTPSGITATELLGGGDGVVLRCKTSGEILSLSRIGGCVHDLEIGADGKIAVCGDFGTGLLSADASEVLWVKTDIKKGTIDAYTGSFYGDFASSSVNMRYRRALSRVSIGSDGTVASMQQPLKYYDEQYNIRPTPYCWVYIYDIDGNELGRFTADDKYSEDICVDGKNKLVIHAGWNPKHHDWGSVKDHPIHVPFMRAYTYSASLEWENYDWTALACYQQNSFADSRVSEVVIGNDGYLYMAGYIHGGDHLWKLGPKKITDRPDVFIGYDNYSNPTNMGPGIDHAYFCKYDPVNGDILKGQAAIVRENADGSGRPRQSQIKGLDAGPDGTVYMSGYCQEFLPNRSSVRINGIAVGSVSSSTPAAEPFVLIVNPDWKSRKAWVSFSKSGCEGIFWGLGCRNGVVATAGTIFKGSAIVSKAEQPSSGGLHEGYIVAWSDGATQSMPRSYTSIQRRAKHEGYSAVYDATGRLIRQQTPRTIAPLHLTNGIFFLTSPYREPTILPSIK